MVFTASAASLPNQNRQNNMKTVIAWDLLAPSNQKIEVNKNACISIHGPRYHRQGSAGHRARARVIALP